MTTIEQAIKNRISVRDFENTGLTNDQIARIKQILTQELLTPFGTKARFDIINIKEFAQQEKVKLGTYGFIKGAEWFIVGATQNTKEALIDYGFALEKIILDLTNINIGTCWLGGSFSRAKFGKTIAMKSNEVIPAISPIGIGKTSSFRNKIIRSIAGSKKRKPFNQLFFNGSFSEPMFENISDLTTALDLVRLAPSADNFQPWRILIDEEKNAHFYLKRNAILNKTIKSADLQYIDMGIAMCHFQYAIKGENEAIKWQNAQPELSENDSALEYILSWMV